MANYVKPKELLDELIISLDQDEMTSNLVTLIMMMVKKIVGPPLLYFKNVMDQDDCRQAALEVVIMKWREFDPNHPSSNPFAWITQIIKNGAAKGFGVLQMAKPAKKGKNGQPDTPGIKIVSLNDENGIYNI